MREAMIEDGAAMCEFYAWLESALGRYKHVVELDRGYQPALSSLGRLYYQAGRWEDLLDTYKRELEVAGGLVERARFLDVALGAQEDVGHRLLCVCRCPCHAWLRSFSASGWGLR